MTKREIAEYEIVEDLNRKAYKEWYELPLDSDPCGQLDEVREIYEQDKKNKALLIGGVK